MPKFIKNIKIENFKSIKQMDLQLQDINILIGANGSGKSNLLSLFEFLRQIALDNLANYVQKKGNKSDYFLCYGSKESKYLKIDLNFDLNFSNKKQDFSITLVPDSSKNLVFAGLDKQINDLDENNTGSFKNTILCSFNDTEYSLMGLLNISSLLQIRSRFKINTIQIFHLNNTSDDSPLKIAARKNLNDYLRSDCSNLFIMLKRIHDSFPEQYNYILNAIRTVVPDFENFYWSDVKWQIDDSILLEWINKNDGPDNPYTAEYLSDGALRFIALVTILLMPEVFKPKLIILDEPELGLHPLAINVLSGLIKMASKDSQIIVATQSNSLLKHFTPEQVLVVEKEDKYTVINKLDKAQLKKWLKEYDLGQLWDMNVLGGRP
jgi:predicted ATPase